jgi:uncharacterized protein
MTFDALTLDTNKEETLLIRGNSGNIEAVFQPADMKGHFAARNWIAIVCHPLPTQGGTMHNKVVTTLVRTYRDLGLNVLRFNFRGVGQSQGQFDHGKGEVDDVESVMTWAQQQFPQSSQLLAGFSFGSSMAAQASYKNPVRHLTLVAPPIERYHYDQKGQFSCPVCVIQGEKDEIVNAQSVIAWAQQLKGEVELLKYPEATHFFHGLLTQLKQDLAEILIRQLRDY